MGRLKIKKDSISFDVNGVIKHSKSAFIANNKDRGIGDEAFLSDVYDECQQAMSKTVVKQPANDVVENENKEVKKPRSSKNKRKVQEKGADDDADSNDNDVS